MSLKPPKYLYLKAREAKTRIPGFTTIEQPDSWMYKPGVCWSEAGGPAEEDWRLSCKQVLGLALMDLLHLHRGVKSQTHIIGEGCFHSFC